MDASENHIQNSRALLIDLDNCPKQLENLSQTVTEFSRIVACYGGGEPKVPLKLVPLLANAINEKKLEIVGMEKKGKNAADFGLAFWAGKLVGEMPPETEFLVLSNDTDLDHVINMLRKAGRIARRLNGKEYSAASYHDEVQETDLNDTDSLNYKAAQGYYLKHLKIAKTKPAKKTTLSNSIKSFYKKRKDISPKLILDILIKHNFVVIDEKGCVTYPAIVKLNDSNMNEIDDNILF